MSVNKLRGEVTVKIGDIEIVMVATMDGLARLSSSIEAQTLADLYRRLIGCEIATTMAAIRAFTIRGTDAEGKALKADAAAKAALAVLALDDAAALTEGFAALLSALVRKPAEQEENERGKPDAPTQ